jgi:succinyl-diaminopimelate desuccinylase
VSGPEADPELAERLAARTFAFVDIPSVSGDEGAILHAVADLMPTQELKLIDDGDGVAFFVPGYRRPDVPLVLLAGHVDTVPPNATPAAGREGEAIFGRGAADMKGALAVMLEIAISASRTPSAGDLDVGFLFFGREELPITESALLPFLDRCEAARSADLAIVMEPTANAIEVGCLGNLNARLTVRGEAAHTARPWLGRNAIHAAVGALGPLSDLPPRDVEIDGLIYREVASVTSIEGGIAGNVVPDRVEAWINFRYAPTRSPTEAEARLRELVSDPSSELEVVANAPPGPVAVRDPLVERLRAAGDLAIGPKQAWTPVAEFATVGVAAINFGPGDPQYAHRDDERVEASALVRSYEVLRAFLAAQEAG